MAEGRTNAGIAHALFIQEATVVKHVSNIMTGD
jgi:DNA-binding NarL/FixJ family response regulator